MGNRVPVHRTIRIVLSIFVVSTTTIQRDSPTLCTGAWSQWADLQEPSAASALLRTCPSVTDVSERPSDVSERRKSSEPQAVLARGASMESDWFPAHSESLRQVPATRKTGTTGLLQDRKGCSAESAMRDAVTHMEQSLTRLWINHNSKSNSNNANKNSTASPVSKDTGELGCVTSTRQDGTGGWSGGPVSPVKALFCDDVQLQVRYTVRLLNIVAVGRLFTPE